MCDLQRGKNEKHTHTLKGKWQPVYPPHSTLAATQVSLSFWEFFLGHRGLLSIYITFKVVMTCVLYI